MSMFGNINRAKLKNAGRLLVAFLVLTQPFYLKAPLYTEKKLVLIISSTKTCYTLGEAVFIEEKIVNKSGRTVTFIYPPIGMIISYSCETSGKIDQWNKTLIKGSDDKKVNDVYNEELVDGYFGGVICLDGHVPGNEKIVELKEGEAHGSDFEVSQLIGFDKPGVYRILIGITLNETYGP